MHFLEWKCMNYDKKNSLKFVPKDPIDNIPALVQIMAWRRKGDKTLIIWTNGGLDYTYESLGLIHESLMISQH